MKHTLINILIGLLGAVVLSFYMWFLLTNPLGPKAPIQPRGPAVQAPTPQLIKQ